MIEIPQNEMTVVIPTFNEAGNIANLLGDISAFAPDVQVVIADACSDDPTLAIVNDLRSKLSNLVTVKTASKKPGPAATRNAGAAVADGKLLVFVDGDERLRPNFFQNAFREVKDRRLDAAGCKITPDSKVLIDKVIWALNNHVAVMIQNVFPTAMGGGIIAKKDLFEEMQGFREDLQVCEDFDFAQRAAQISRFGILEREGTDVITSVRRSVSKGALKSEAQYLAHALHYLLTNRPAPKMFGYDFGDY